MRKLFLTCLLSLAASCASLAQETRESGVRITFLPPPTEGTISLGVYDSDGKLVRTLKSEAEEKDFTVGLNGLITVWNGKDDLGQFARPGRYHVRGYTVGALEIEGVAYYCNDWITDDESPRIRHVLSAGRFLRPGEAELPVELVGGKLAGVTITIDPDSGAATIASAADNSRTPADEVSLPAGADSGARVGDTVYALGPGKMWKKNGSDWIMLPIADLERPIAVGGGEETLWVIDSKAGGTLVCEYSKTGELLRALPSSPGEPAPKWIAARGRDELLLVDQGQDFERTRLLWRENVAVDGAGKPVSTWRTVFSKTIRSAPSLEAVIPHLPRLERFKPEPKVPVRLVPNPLLKEAATNVFVEIGCDAQGAILKTSDGLLLIRLTETPGLAWVAMGREAGTKVVTIFQSDGAVVEEFRAGKLANMMAFDAGAYEWAGK